MATALASQLAKIATKGRNPLDLKEQQKAHSQSLIFDPHTAALQDFDTLYELCIEGYQELCQQDSRFSAYSRSLFDENCKGIERTKLTKDQNDDLDTVLENFLLLLAPKISLRPATLALEWLIRRFRVHEYNTTCLVLTLLPYHTRSIFVTLLSILPKVLDPALAFLRPYVEKQEYPPRHAVVYAATHNPAFFSAWSKYTLDSCQQGSPSPVATTYWATAAAEAIVAQLEAAMVGRRDAQSEREGNILRRILPILSKGLALRGAPEMRTACFAIVSILASRVEMESSALASLMEAVVQGRTGRLTSVELVCLALIAQSADVSTLPKSVFKAVTAKQSVGEVVTGLMTTREQCKIGGLCLVLLKTYRRRAKGEDVNDQLGNCIQLLQACVEHDVLSAGQLASAVSTLAVPSKKFSGPVREVIPNLKHALFQSHYSKSTRRKVEEALSLSKIGIGLSSADSEDAQEERPELLPEPNTQIPVPSQAEWDALASEVPHGSFLALPDVPLFGVLMDHVAMDPRTPVTIEKFGKIGAFANQDVQVELPFVTFLLRVLISKASSPQKEASLANLRIFLQRKDLKMDIQIMLPYVIFALGDASPRVRQAAAELTLMLMKYYSALKQDSDAGAKLTILGKGVVHGVSNDESEWLWLSISSSIMFLSRMLVQIVEECRQDPHHVSKALSRTLTKLKSDTDKKQKTFDTTHRAYIFNYLCQVAVASQSTMLKMKFLAIINGVEERKGILKIQQLSPLLDHLSKMGDAELESTCVRDSVDVNRLGSEVLAIITNKKESEVGLATLQALISGSTLGNATSLRFAALERLRALWSGLRRVVRPSFAVLLFRTATNVLPGEDSNFQTAAAATLRELHLSPVDLSALLEEVPRLNSDTIVNSQPTKKRKKNDGQARHSPSIESHEAAWLKTNTCMELVESSEAGRDVSLIAKLFSMLDNMQQFKHHGGQVNAYTQSMLLDCLRRVVGNVDPLLKSNEKLQTTQTDLVVDCFRTAQGPQVRHAALTLLSSMAKMAPDVIIHSVMPIFTLMGSTVLTAGDENSVYIVEQTISSVIPPLLAGFQKQKGGPLTAVSELLSGFVASLDHIPEAQRIGVFSTLVDTLGANEFFYALILLVVNRYHDDQQATDILVQLAIKQSAATLIGTFLKCLEVAQHLITRALTKHGGLVTALSDENHQLIARETISFLALTLSNSRLRKKLAQTIARDEAAAESLRREYAAVTEQALSLACLSGLSRSLSDAVDSFCNSLAGCLPADEFIHALLPLFAYPNHKIQLGAMKSLQGLIEQAKGGEKRVQVACFECLHDMITLVDSPARVAVRVTAILCLDRITEKYGRANPEALRPFPEDLFARGCFNVDEPETCTAALLYLSTLVDVLREEFIKNAPRTLTTALDLLQQAGSSTEQTQVKLQNACYVLLNALLINIPWAVSGQHLDRLLRVSQTSSAGNTDISKLNAGVRSQRAEVLGLVAKGINPSESFGALSRTLRSATISGFDVAKQHLGLVQLAIETHPKSVTINHCQELMAIFLEGLDTRRLRNVNPTQYSYDEGELAELEDDVSKVMIRMIYKLNDTHFRPLFTKGCDWIETRDVGRSKSNKLHRAIAWYGFLASFFGALKSIVTNYTTYTVDSAADLLHQTGHADPSHALLLAHVLATLRASFEHDQDAFWHAHDRFEAILQPLLAHLPLAAAHPASGLLDPLIACVTAFAAAAGSPEHHRAINAAVLPGLRDDDPRVRLAAARCEVSLTKALGEEWLAMLAEMLPFVAEALEDDDERVEREVRGWVREIEALTGESLDAMLQ